MTKFIPNILGEKIKEARENASLTQDELAPFLKREIYNHLYLYKLKMPIVQRIKLEQIVKLPIFII